MGRPEPLTIPKKIIFENEIQAKKELLKNVKKYDIIEHEVEIIKDSTSFYEELLKK